MISKQMLDSWYTPRNLSKVSIEYLSEEEEEVALEDLEPCWCCGKEECACDSETQELLDSKI